jgi:outer membrane receptor protein involved in Fe transport
MRLTRKINGNSCGAETTKGQYVFKGFSLSVIACALASSAMAATGVEADAPAPDNDEIVIIGEKASRTLQQTPTSVAVATADTIATQNLISVYDVLERTPNVSPSGNRTSFSIRGIDAFNVSGGGDGALASVYLDGAVLPQTAVSTGPLDLFDIAQVEVFRGPQSTVQGRNALAGAVIIRTADPTYEWTGRVRALMTDKDGERRVGTAFGGPIVDGQIAFRVAGEVARADGLIDNVTLNANGGERRSETVRGKLLFTPDFLPGLRVVATYMHDRHRRGTYWTELDPPYDPKDRIATEDTQDVNTVKSDIATLDIGYSLAPWLSVNAVTNYSDIRSRYEYDQDRGANPGQAGVILDPSKTFQQELRFNIDKGWVKGLIGGYYLREDNRDYFFESRQLLGLRRLGVDQTLLSMGVPQSTVDAILNLYGGTVPIANTLLQPRLTHNYAGFFDLTFPITSRLRVVTGLRYDSESQDRGATQTVTITKPLPDPASLSPALAPIVTQLNALLAATAAAATSNEPVRTVTYHAWLPKVGLTYDFTTDLSVSLTAQRGYRAGGAGLNQQRGQYYSYNPEYTWNYELALRSEFLDRRLTVNANVYYIDWRDQQVSVRLTPGSAFDTQTINAGRSRLYGAELELQGRPSRTIRLSAGAGYSNTRFDKFDISVGSASGAAVGNEFANAPHWTLSGSATWQHPNGLLFNVNGNYRSAFYQDTVVQTVRDIGSLTLVNAKVGWQGEHFGAFVTVRNLFDAQKPTQSFLDLDGHLRGVMSDPRTIGISFEGRF